MNAAKYDVLNIESVEVEEILAENIVEIVDVCDGTVNARYHSELAMQAARKMRRTRQKLKTGQLVCHHLRLMLASDKPIPMASDWLNEPQFHLGF